MRLIDCVFLILFSVIGMIALFAIGYNSGYNDALNDVDKDDA